MIFVWNLVRTVYQEDLQGALISLFFSFVCMFLAIYWTKVWKKADYMISRAIHSPYPDEEDNKK
jgi:hypothetical protein